LIVGQGLAGTVLGHACERAGIAFDIVDAGHAGAASRVGAGIINPITGQRIVKSWEIDALRPVAAETYRGLEAVLGVSLIREMRVRRLFRDEAERRVFAEKNARGELAPYAGASDDEGFWIEGALRVDTAALIAAARARWLAAGRLREARRGIADALVQYETVIACTGADDDGGRAWAGVSCTRATGEILRVAVGGLAPDVILNGGHWVLPTAPGEARVGATYRRGEPVAGAAPGVGGDAGAKANGVEARVELERSAAALLGGREFAVTAQESGVRVTAPDRRPLAGRDPREPRLGFINGLGSKGALLAPWLAGQWARHLTAGVAFEPAVEPGRFGR
jgi:glycine/D-amino acid oxidase-like deaminating enzyme